MRHWQNPRWLFYNISVPINWQNLRQGIKLTKIHEDFANGVFSIIHASIKHWRKFCQFIGTRTNVPEAALRRSGGSLPAAIICPSCIDPP